MILNEKYISIDIVLLLLEYSITKHDMIYYLYCLATKFFIDVHFFCLKKSKRKITFII